MHCKNLILNPYKNRDHLRDVVLNKRLTIPCSLYQFNNKCCRIRIRTIHLHTVFWVHTVVFEVHCDFRCSMWLNCQVLFTVVFFFIQIRNQWNRDNTHFFEIGNFFVLQVLKSTKINLLENSTHTYLIYHHLTTLSYLTANNFFVFTFRTKWLYCYRHFKR